MRAAWPTRTRGSRSGTTTWCGPTAAPGSTASSTSRALAAGVVVLDDEDRVLLVGQHRYALDAYSWEIPEGGVPAGETALDGARRELREETGVVAARWREIGRFHLSNSVTDEAGVLYLATDLVPAGGRARGDGGAGRPLGPVRRGAGDDPRRPDHRRDGDHGDPARRPRPPPRGSGADPPDPRPRPRGRSLASAPGARSGGLARAGPGAPRGSGRRARGPRRRSPSIEPNSRWTSSRAASRYAGRTPRRGRSSSGSPPRAANPSMNGWMTGCRRGPLRR